MFYQMKTSFLTETLTDIMDDDDEDDNKKEQDNDNNNENNLSEQFTSGFLEVSQVSNTHHTEDRNRISNSSIHELLNSSNNLHFPDKNNHFYADEAVIEKKFEAVGHMASNDNAWNERLNKPPPPSSAPQQSSKTKSENTTAHTRLVLKMENMILKKPPRNP